jgi:hypothetical protein
VLASTATGGELVAQVGLALAALILLGSVGALAAINVTQARARRK